MNSWRELFEQEMARPYWPRLQAFVAEERQKYRVYPDGADVFNALRMTPLKRTKVVIVGQDPYHGAGQAHGLAFSVRAGVSLPPSLLNVLSEAANDLGEEDQRWRHWHPGSASGGDLTPWAGQGVLLLNTALTVREGAAGSHAKAGWHQFTSAALLAVAEANEHVVFVRWGSHARSATQQIVDRPELYFTHTWIDSTHPSPLSAHRPGRDGTPAFVGSRPFTRTNTALVQNGQESVDWRLP